MRSVWHVLVSLVIFIATLPAALAAEDMVLQTVMKGHAKNMQLIAGGIAHENHEQVETAARAVIDPPHPSSTLAEKLRLVRFLGSKLGRFKALDEATKQRAAVLASAARSQNGEATIAAFQQLQMSCLACHNEFRKPFQDYFNP
jgi:hypothetical protein